MRFIIPKLNIPPQNFLRQCGYQEIENPHKNNEISYARSLDPGRFYPRFHAYLELTSPETKLNLHLDMKKPSYAGATAHSGEYGGEIIAGETKRIMANTKKFLVQNAGQPTLGFSRKKSFWRKIKDYFTK